MSEQFYIKQFTLVSVRRLLIKTVLFQIIQFNISTRSCSILPIDRTLKGATTPGNEGVLCIPQSSSIIGTSPSDCLVLYPGHSCWKGVSYYLAEVLSVYSTTPVDWATYVKEYSMSGNF